MKAPADKFIHSDATRKLEALTDQKAFLRAFEESVKRWEKLETRQSKKT